MNREKYLNCKDYVRKLLDLKGEVDWHRSRLTIGVPFDEGDVSDALGISQEQLENIVEDLYYEHKYGFERHIERVLWSEFSEFYRENRPPDTPIEAAELFELCLEGIYPRYRRLLDEFTFFEIVRDVLGGAPYKKMEGWGVGVFQTFDYERTNKRTSPKNKFRNYFRRRLESRITSHLRDRHRSNEPCPSIPDPRYLDRKHRDALDHGLERLAAQDAELESIVRRIYFLGEERARIAEDLGLHRNTIGNKHKEALAILREEITEYLDG